MVTSPPTDQVNVASLEISHLVRDAEWDRFVCSVRNSHFEQSSGWGAVRVRYGWKVWRVIARQENQIMGGLQVLTKSIGLKATIGYVSRGPIVAAENHDLAEPLISQVEDIAARERWIYAVIDYAYDHHALATQMARRGYFAHPAGIPPSGLLDATALLDLRSEESVILSRMNTSVRRNVRRSQRSGLTFSLGGAEDVPKFRELMLATCARRHSSPTPPQPDYFAHLWTEFGLEGHARLFLVHFGDEMVSAAFAFTMSNTVRVWKVGWSGAHADKDPNHFMWWEIMKWSKTRGHDTLDFVWVDTLDAKLVACGKTSPEGFRDGTTYFKMGFGGSLFFPPPVQSRFFHPMARLAYRCGGARLLASSRFQRLLASYWSGAASK